MEPLTAKVQSTAHTKRNQTLGTILAGLVCVPLQLRAMEMGQLSSYPWNHANKPWGNSRTAFSKNDVSDAAATGGSKSNTGIQEQRQVRM